jgi:hypothetical protein
MHWLMPLLEGAAAELRLQSSECDHEMPLRSLHPIWSLTVGSCGGRRHDSSKVVCGKLSTKAALYFWSVPRNPASP